LAWICSNDLSEGYNYGSYMRWNAAIVEMDRYYKTPVLYRNMGIEMFCNYWRFCKSHFSRTNLWWWSKTNSYDSKEFGIEISVLFFLSSLKIKKHYRSIMCKKLYTLLNSDLSAQFEDSSLEIIRLAAQNAISASR
jgi:hypothetical protein